MRNPNHGATRAFFFLFSVLLILTALRFMPAFSMGDYEVKRVDLFADVMPKEKTLQETPHTVPPVRQKAVFRDTCPQGMVCIEDYSPDGKHGIKPFYAALSNRNKMNRPVRVAYFGDSFIEGDIMTEELRLRLQKKFGGCGVGYVDIASPFTQLRSTLHYKADGWTEHNVLEKSGTDNELLGISGRYARANSGAFCEYSGIKGKEKLDTFEVATLYISSSTPCMVQAQANGSTEGIPLSLKGNGSIEALTTERRMGRIRYDIPAGTTAFGVALESRKGVIVDNFSLRGSSGMQMGSFSENRLSAWHSTRPYDLIVLQYGLNVANKKQTDYSTYARRMKNVVEHLKSSFPEAGLLIVGIGDREDRQDGQLQTMRGIRELSAAQQQVAAECGIAYWDLFHAMGGEGSMKRMAEAKPAEAQKDYTHINRKGGQRIGGILYRTIAHGYGQYEKKKKYENK